jgi:hydrogenase expression/formation protein HypC
MCLAVPMRIESIEGSTARLEADGVRQNANIELVPGAKIGDYVIVHAGFAIQILDLKEARERLKLFEELDRFSRGAHGTD